MIEFTAEDYEKYSKREDLGVPRTVHVGEAEGVEKRKISDAISSPEEDFEKILPNGKEIMEYLRSLGE